MFGVGTCETFSLFRLLVLGLGYCFMFSCSLRQGQLPALMQLSDDIVLKRNFVKCMFTIHLPLEGPLRLKN